MFWFDMTPASALLILTIILNHVSNVLFFLFFFAESRESIDDGQFGIYSKSALMTRCGVLLHVNAQKIGIL